MKKNTKKGMKSVFGESPRRIYVNIEKLKNHFTEKYKVLVVDAVDGNCVLPFARNKVKIDAYEENKIYLKGGVFDEFKLVGLKSRLENELLCNYVNIVEENFYLSSATKKYDLIIVYRSLHKKNNANITMKRKMNKLLSSVKNGGYIYLVYYLANNENDYVNYPKNQYFRLNEIKKYINDDFKIVSHRETNTLNKHKSHPLNKHDHYHKIGYLFLNKINTKLDYKFNYNYKIIIK